MKKSELKAVLKPIIEECLRESFVENGFLGKVITEVIRASQEANVLIETKEEKSPSSFPSVLPNKQTPKKETPRLKAAKELEKQGYFAGLSLPEMSGLAATPKRTIVEGVDCGVLPIDEFVQQPGLSEDVILRLMGKQ